MSDELAGLSDTDLASIRQIYRTMAETTLNGDWDGWASILEEHAVVVPPNQEPVAGRGTLRDWIEGFGTFISHDITPHEIEGRGDLAFVRLRADVEVRLEDGSVVTDHARGMNILRRQSDGSWKLSRMLWNSGPQVAG